MAEKIFNEEAEEQMKMQLFYLIAQELDVEGEVEISENMKLIEDFGYDSLQLINLILNIESTFRIEFQDTDMLFESYNRIGDLYSLVKSLMQS